MGLPELSLTVPLTVRVWAMAGRTIKSSSEISVISFFIVVQFSWNK